MQEMGCHCCTFLLFLGSVKLITVHYMNEDLKTSKIPAAQVWILLGTRLYFIGWHGSIIPVQLSSPVVYIAECAPLFPELGKSVAS